MQRESSNTFSRIYQDYYRKSFLFVKSYVHDDFAAEDIVSESMIKLWEKMKTEHIRSVQTFLFTILKNKALDYLKHESIKVAAHKEINELLSRELDIWIVVLESCDPNEIFSKEVQAIYQQTMQEIPKKTSTIFEMSRIYHKPNREIAGELGITVKGVDYHIGLALKALKRSLKDYLPLFTFFFLH